MTSLTCGRLHQSLAVELALLFAGISRQLLRQVAVVLKDVLIGKYWLQILQAIVLLLDAHDPVLALALRNPLGVRLEEAHVLGLQIDVEDVIALRIRQDVLIIGVQSLDRGQLLIVFKCRNHLLVLRRQVLMAEP